MTHIFVISNNTRYHKYTTNSNQTQHGWRRRKHRTQQGWAGRDDHILHGYLYFWTCSQLVNNLYIFGEMRLSEICLNLFNQISLGYFSDNFSNLKHQSIPHVLIAAKI